MRLFTALLLALGFTVGCRDAKSQVGSRPVATPASAGAEPSAAPRANPKEPEALEAPRPGDEVRVRATHPSGAPLHPEPGSSKVSGRLADGSVARIERVQEGRWFEVSQSSLRGWVTRRYLAFGQRERSSIAADSPFSSREACLARVARQERLERKTGVARIGSWNLHWFPDKKPGNQQGQGGADLEWLACAITFLNVDVLAVQEVKGTPRARQALAELVRRLDELSGGAWQASVDDCPKSSSQHVALLYDERRVSYLGGGTLAELNPHGEPCKDQLRPGLGAYFRFPGGLDLHVVSVHFKSGGKARDYGLRRRSFESLSEAFDAAQKIARDEDVLVLGDLNTMGCPDCSPAKSPEAELTELGPLLEKEGFRRLESDVGCTFHFEGRGTLLDGALVSRALREAEGATVRVGGACATLGCERVPERHAARSALSDHCPITIDLTDRDLD